MNRRDVLRNAAYAAALFGVPARGATGPVPALPDDSVFRKDPEAYWSRLRDDQFLLPGWRAFMNNGSLGIAPKTVVKAVTDYLNSMAALEMDYYPRWGYETLDDFRTELAEYIGCKKDEVAMAHNATEALSTIAAGIDLKAGDEVVMTDQEHPSGRSGWQVRQARHGIQVREVKLPLPPKSPEQLTDIMISAIGPRTRVLFFSGIMSPTGLLMPIRQICEAAREKGVITVVDGAHMHGQVDVKISQLGCDYFAGSPHKWMFAPAGSGFLYVREENLDRLWPTIVTGGWDKKEIKAARFQMMGTNNRAIFEGMIAGLRFAKSIGPERIYARTHELARSVYEKARAVPYLNLLSPEDDRMYGALVTFEIKKDAGPFVEACRKKKIWIAGAPRLRVSTHIHTRPRDIDLMFATLRESLG
ncbi:MAG TPA: aminotransferase class V-fold PLP-dependent enzyme [Bryobacteraceae bacterium]|nr:aminotransferase class V-fold PLP-dependent enzyme [Bryobacteraceae bacterium]